MPTYIALLRAINVGGTGKLPMKDLRAACEKVGLRQVSTYIASGNVVFSSNKSATAVKALIAEVLHVRFALTKNHVLIRSPGELAKVISANPFPEAAADHPNWFMINFLDGHPRAGTADALTAYNGPERLHLSGSHLYIDYVEGVARSKLTPAFLDKALKVPATGRNWNTTNKLLEMARALEQAQPG
jgi:uncharacterized protein (DUF1697 family)